MQLEKRVTMAVCDVNGIVTKAQVDEIERLRALVGEKFDAINFKWVPLDN